MPRLAPQFAAGFLAIAVLSGGCSASRETDGRSSAASPARVGSASRAERARAEGPEADVVPVAVESHEPTPTAFPRAPTADERARYPWLPDGIAIRPLDQAIPAPPGFTRVAEAPQSFGAWLRKLPLRPAGTPVRAYDGDVLRSGDDPRIAAVVEVDVSPVDLQQCADSVIRMHAEWLWATDQKTEIGYHFLSGDFAKYSDYAAGDRPVVDGQHIRFARSAKPNDDHETFRKYLDLVFTYASTISVARRSETLTRADLQPGDFVVLPGGPGHAILILDVAVDAKGHKLALLGQGYMPAQDFQVLHAGQADGNVGPWFSLDGDGIDTPFWPAPFPWSSLRRMRG